MLVLRGREEGVPGGSEYLKSFSYFGTREVRIEPTEEVVHDEKGDRGISGWFS